MIPKIIHQIWVGKYSMPEREKNISKILREKHTNYHYYLWTDSNLPEIPHHLQKIYETMYTQKDYVFCADILRWLVVYEYGGWYLDIDWEYKKSLDDYDINNMYGVVFGHWGGGDKWLTNKIGSGWKHIDHTITNNIFAFVKKHPILEFLINNMSTNINYSNAPHSPHWTGLQIKKFIDLDNEFTQDVWYYHDTMKKKLNKINIEYGDYNTFQNEILKHHSLYSWSIENKEKFAKGLIV